MFYKFISWFLFFTILNILFEVETWNVLWFIVLGLMSYRISIGHYKTFLKDIGPMSYMSFIVLMSFMLSKHLVLLRSQGAEVFYFKNNLHLIEGRVVAVSQKDTRINVSLEPQRIVNLENNLEIKDFPKYLNLSVSSLTDYKLLENLEVVGEISFQDFYSNRKNFGQNSDAIVGGGEKLFYNTNYQVSNIKNISVTQNPAALLWYQALQIKFWETSKDTQNKIDAFVKDPYLGIGKGITYGNQENIIKEVRQKFIDSGLIHIMVLSGANVSFIILLFMFILSKISYPRITSNPEYSGLRNFFNFRNWKKINLQAKVWATVLASTIFIFATGLAAPSIRAGVMVNSALFAEYYSKKFSVKKSILLSLFILTLINPFALVYSASLHLSYLAIFGLVFLLPKIYKIIDTFFSTTLKLWSHHTGQFQNLVHAKNKEINTESVTEINILLNIFSNNFWKGMLATFLAITISVGPYLLAMSEKINLLGTVATIILEPIILLVTIFTFLVTATSFFSSFLASIFGVLDTFFISIILYSAEFLSQEIFILNLSLSPNLVIIYYLVFVGYFFVLNND